MDDSTRILTLNYLVKKFRDHDPVILNEYEKEFIAELLEKELRHTLRKTGIRIKI